METLIPYRIAIPSFRRCATLRQKTLRFLSSCGVDMSRVYVFVADSAEHAAYAPVQQQFGVRLVVGAHTLCGQRGFIQHFFAEGTPVVMCDDDLDALFIKTGSNSTQQVATLDDFHHVVSEGFAAMRAAGNKIWGISAVNNGFFMKFDISFNLKYLVGCFWGCEISHDPALQVTLEDKEDFERTLLYYCAFGSSPRLNWVAPKTNYYTEPGGMQVTRTERRVTESALSLIKRFPGLCHLNTQKKNTKHTEIKLRATRPPKK